MNSKPNRVTLSLISEELDYEKYDKGYENYKFDQDKYRKQHPGGIIQLLLVYKSFAYRLRELMEEYGGKKNINAFVRYLRDKGLNVTRKSIYKYLEFEKLDETADNKGFLFNGKSSPFPPLTFIYDLAKVTNIDPGWFIDYRYPSRHLIHDLFTMAEFFDRNNIYVKTDEGFMPIWGSIDFMENSNISDGENEMYYEEEQLKEYLNRKTVNK